MNIKYMEINITDNIRVISDDYNYILQERHRLKTNSFGKKKGEYTGWNDYGYYQDWEYLLEDLIHLKIRRSSVKTLEEVVDTIKSFKTLKTPPTDARMA